MAVDRRMGQSVKVALARTEWHTEWVFTTADAISRISSSPRTRFDAVLTQAEFSDSHGQDLLRHVVGNHPHLPVLFAADSGSEDEIVAALLQGAAGYIVVTRREREQPGRRAADALQSATASNVITRRFATLFPAVLEQAVRRSRQQELELQAAELSHRQQLDSLCAALRHQLNNPLTGILGNAEMGLATPNLPTALQRRLVSLVQMAEQIRVVLRLLETHADRPTHLIQALNQ